VRVLEIAALEGARDAQRKFDDRAPAPGHEAIDADVRQTRSSTVITQEDLQVWPRSLEPPRDAAILSRVLHAPEQRELGGELRDDRGRDVSLSVPGEVVEQQGEIRPEE
jgi:hypothetical protein